MNEAIDTRFSAAEFAQVDSPPARLGGAIKRAYCKTNAGSGSTIVCYLGIDATGTEITVNCDLFEATDLSACLPLLTDGKAIPVYKVGDNWYCAWWFSGTEDCADG